MRRHASFVDGPGCACLLDGAPTMVNAVWPSFDTQSWSHWSKSASQGAALYTTHCLFDSEVTIPAYQLESQSARNGNGRLSVVRADSSCTSYTMNPSDAKTRLR